MSNAKLDKLSQIKLKYGYASEQKTQPITDLKAYMSNIREKSSYDNPFQKISISKAQQEVPKAPSQVKYHNQFADNQDVRERTASVNFQRKTIEEPKAYQSNITPFLFVKTQKNEQVDKRQRPVIKEPAALEDRNESKREMKSIEKTYDLLNNYRRKIRTGFDCDRNDQSHKKLKIKEDKQNLPKQTQCSTTSFNSKTKQQLTKDSYNSIQRSTPGKKQRQSRCSALSSLDQNSVDIQKELSNIERLQYKIRSVLGGKQSY